MLKLAIIASLVASPPGPLMGFFDGQGLVEACTATGEQAIAQHAVCLGYVSGAVDMALSEQASVTPERRLVCPPMGTKLGQAVTAVLARASWASRARGLGAASFVKLALQDAYPCRPDQDVM